MKVQINSLEALKRLIGDDKELEAQIKLAVLNGYTKNHIKAILNDEVISKLKLIISKEIEKTDYFGMLKKEPYYPYYSLSKSALNKIETESKDAFDDLVRSYLKKYIDSQSEYIKDRIDTVTAQLLAKFEIAIHKYTEDNIKSLLDEIAKERLKMMIDGFNTSK